MAGPEFGDREGHTLIIVKELYGLKSSVLRWWERLSDVLTDMDFFPSKSEQDIWMRLQSNKYEYITRYVDDLTIVSKDPKGITNTLENSFGLTLQGTGPIKYHLG